MSDYGDQGSNDVKSESATSPLTAAELNNGGLHRAAVPAAVRHHPSSAPSATQSPQFTAGTSPLMYAGGPGPHGFASLVDAAGRGCPPLTAAGTAALDDDQGFLAMNVAAAAAAAAAAGTFNIGYNRL